MYFSCIDVGMSIYQELIYNFTFFTQKGKRLTSLT
nr:MAG TPA: hypothetical protein [Caudoviricetes sp.]